MYRTTVDIIAAFAVVVRPPPTAPTSLLRCLLHPASDSCVGLIVFLCQRAAGFSLCLTVKGAGRLDLSSVLALEACWRNRRSMTPPCFRRRGCSEGDRHANKRVFLLKGVAFNDRQVLLTAAAFFASASSSVRLCHYQGCTLRRHA